MSQTTYRPDDSTDARAGDGVGGGQKLAYIMLVAVIGGMSVLAYRLYPDDHREAINPTFVDNIFASNLVIFVARITLLLGAGVLAAGMYFVVLSIWKRARAGHYLTRFGPFETQAIEDLRGEVETWRAYCAEGNRKVAELDERVEESDVLIAELRAELREANRLVKTLREQASS